MEPPRIPGRFTTTNPAPTSHGSNPTRPNTPTNPALDTKRIRAQRVGAEGAAKHTASAAAMRRRVERAPIVLMEGGVHGASVVRSVEDLTGVSLECPAT